MSLTMAKLQSQFVAVEIADPFCLMRRGKISLGYVHTTAWKPVVKRPMYKKRTARQHELEL
jgi:hypothetical protein